MPPSLNVTEIRRDFPVLDREVRPGIPLVYLDSTATSQKPAPVIEAMNEYYRRHNANIHRGIHALAEEATALYEQAREKIAAFINARSHREVVFTRNTTEAINLVAFTWGRIALKPGDLVVLTEMEHHSNIVPWQILVQQQGIRLKYIPVTPEGYLDLDAYEKLLEEQPRLVSFTHMSNVLGTITPARNMIARAKAAGAMTLLDGAQSVPHFKVDVQELDVDFMAFSAHKMLGPTGTGILYGKEKHLLAMPPFLGGGDMIRRVTFDGFIPNELPHKFEAGTPAIAEAIGFGAAVDYLVQVGMENISQHEHALTAYALDRMAEIPGVKVFGPPAEAKGGVVSFTLQGVHAHDVAEILNQYGVAVRAGHHCAMPLHQKFGIAATARASFYLYNTPEEIDRLVEAIYQVKHVFG